MGSRRYSIVCLKIEGNFGLPHIDVTFSWLDPVLWYRPILTLMKVSCDIYRVAAALVAVVCMLFAPALSAEDEHACCPVDAVVTANQPVVAAVDPHVQHNNQLLKSAETENASSSTALGCDLANCATTASAQLLLAAAPQATGSGIDRQTFLSLSETASSAQYTLATPPPRPA